MTDEKLIHLTRSLTWKPPLACFPKEGATVGHISLRLSVELLQNGWGGGYIISDGGERGVLKWHSFAKLAQCFSHFCILGFIKRASVVGCTLQPHNA